MITFKTLITASGIFLVSVFGAFGYYVHIYMTKINLEILMLKEHNRDLELKVAALEQQSQENLRMLDTFSANNIHLTVVILVGAVVIGSLVLLILCQNDCVPQTDYDNITRVVDANSHRLIKSFDSKLEAHSSQLIQSINTKFKEQSSSLYNSVTSKMYESTDKILNTLDAESANILFQDILLKESTNIKLELCLEIIKELKALEATPANCQIAIDIVASIAEKIV